LLGSIDLTPTLIGFVEVPVSGKWMADHSVVKHSSLLSLYQPQSFPFWEDQEISPLVHDRSSIPIVLP